MELIRKVDFTSNGRTKNDYIIKLDLSEVTIVNHNLGGFGTLDGQYIHYIHDDPTIELDFNNAVHTNMILRTIRPEMSFVTQKEAELHTAMKMYHNAYLDLLHKFRSLRDTSENVIYDSEEIIKAVREVRGDIKEE